MIIVKLVTVTLLKIKIFQNNSYDVIIDLHDVTENIVSRVSNYIAHVVLWSNFGNSSISMREVIKTSIL